MQLYEARRYHRLRMEAVMALGGECVVCGFDDERALHIDHVHGDGKHERKRKSGASYCVHVVREASSGRYQLLCSNHHDIKSHTNGERGRPRKQLQDLENDQ